MRTTILASVVALTAACASTPSYVGDYAPSAYRAASYDGAVTDEPSLFKSDTDVLSDSAIRRILAFRFTLPESSRVAVLHLGARSVGSYRWATPSPATDTLLTGFLAALRASPRVRTVSLLPALLVPVRRTVGYLREAAARYQADLLFVFSTDCQTYERYRIFAANEVKATCIVEAVLIDTRTGIVPFTANASRSFETRKTHDDTNWAETVRRAEQQTIGQALAEIGERTAAYLQAER
ncbi:hypothetical protein YTPLAS18_40420 [Nitrospira sp.]|nr:hypothetical protein YTPLAS18_40420 [Nitrospira sp.]